MTVEQQTVMTGAETDALLGRHETGVLSLARGDEPYAVPISYGYDAGPRQFCMRLVSTPESRKRRFLTDSPRVRFVVYEEDETTYRSVIADGRLEHLPKSELTADHVERYGSAKRPLFEMWGEPKADLTIDLYELEPDELSGRRIDVEQ
ncbi:pyridoxamine 5'-phosphate oxidase family protein [Haloplanus salinarum]|jgi:nitroimidazol reductase NimA-like FMN-containing flavoprotein (pyridoxamine 5'-phosphate oxidase superfamily)|uniref:pyridoxamine 5'-phosphate oxidase family protein n=1 Tax=Haloplanus salinarum TaxID=1912324 RepID=UPI00214AA5BE|nr:pyridoxamine 5'-phosphate oxidase family protein [Haloplanus salinarum]